MMKKHGMRNALVFVLTAVFALSLCGTTALANEGIVPQTGSTFYANISVGGSFTQCTFKVTSENTVQIGDGSNKAIDSAASGALVIPGTVSDGTTSYSVTALGNECFNDCDGITDTGLSTNATVKTLGDNCFANCDGITETGLSTNGTVTTLEDDCFGYCSKLAHTCLAGNEVLTTLGDSNFEKCTSLTDTGLAENHTVVSLGKSCFYGCSGLATTGLAGNTKVTTVGEYCFYNCRGLTDTGLATNTTVTSLGEGCFNGCAVLANAALPSSLASCGNSIFDNDCSGLKSVCLYGNLRIDLGGNAPSGLAVYYLAGNTNAASSAREGDTTYALTTVTVDGGAQSASTNYWCTLANTASYGRQVEGQTVTVVADAVAGSTFDHWEVVSGDITLGSVSSATTSFVAGAENVELKAVYTTIPSPVPSSNTTGTTSALPNTGDSLVPALVLLVFGAMVLGAGLVLVVRQRRL